MNSKCFIEDFFSLEVVEMYPEITIGRMSWPLLKFNDWNNEKWALRTYPFSRNSYYSKGLIRQIWIEDENGGSKVIYDYKS